MRVEREPIFHDRQFVVTPNTPITTTSNVFVDVPGATITTKDLGSDGAYIAWISMEVDHSNNNSDIEFRGVLNGTPTDGRTIRFGAGAAGDPQSVEIQGFGFNIPPTSIIKLQWRTSNGTATILDQNMIIDGVPNNRVV